LLQKLLYKSKALRAARDRRQLEYLTFQKMAVKVPMSSEQTSIVTTNLAVASSSNRGPEQYPGLMEDQAAFPEHREGTSEMRPAMVAGQASRTAGPGGEARGALRCQKWFELSLRLGFPFARQLPFTGSAKELGHQMKLGIQSGQAVAVLCHDVEKCEGAAFLSGHGGLAGSYSIETPSPI
jgi:hypothetical protein